ncbi:MAG: hypothetical protein RQ826_17120 [Xanthomonadales bacterium]|nr:hypothetical protein [Xanthomonadales bacterium]
MRSALRIASARGVAICCVVALGSGWSLARAGDKWIEARSDNFVIFSDAGENRTRELVVELEKFRFVVEQITPVQYPAVENDRPLTVFAYDSTRNYVKQTGMNGTAGVYVSRTTGAVSVLSLEEAEEIWQLDGREVLLHEYTHHLLHHYSGAHYPRWYDEGFAEFMAAIEFDDDEVILGHPAVHRFLVLRNVGEWVDIETIIESKGRYLGDLSSGLSRDPNKYKLGMPYQYAQGWLLTHMLHAREKLRPALARYLRELSMNPEASEEIFERAFGMPYREMGRLLREYWSAGELPLLAVGLKDVFREPELLVRELSEQEADLIHDFARIRSGLGKHGRGMRKRLERALEAGFRPARMHEFLARFHLRDERPERAAPHVDYLLAKRPDSALGPILKMSQIMMAADDDDPQPQARLEAMCQQAIAIAPDDGEALLNCVRVDLREAGTVDSQTLDRIMRVRRQFPDVSVARVLELKTLIELERFAVAEARARQYVGWASSRDEANRFEKFQREAEVRSTERSSPDS